MNLQSQGQRSGSGDRTGRGRREDGAVFISVCVCEQSAEDVSAKPQIRFFMLLDFSVPLVSTLCLRHKLSFCWGSENIKFGFKITVSSPQSGRRWSDYSWKNRWFSHHENSLGVLKNIQRFRWESQLFNHLYSFALLHLHSRLSFPGFCFRRDETKLLHGDQSN